MYWNLYALLLIVQIAVKIKTSDISAVLEDEASDPTHRDLRWIKWSKSPRPTRTTKPYVLWEMGTKCSTIKRSARSIVRRLYAVLPYFDKDHANGEFLHKMRTTLRTMTESKDALHREAAFHASLLIPLIFIEDYKDSWCILERFHRALVLFQISSTAGKISSLRHLQNIRSINQKVRMFVFDLPGPKPPEQEVSTEDLDMDLRAALEDTKEGRYVNELIKNLG